jgi:predicted ester cyclase
VSAEDAKALMRRAYEAFNARDLAALETLLAPDFVDHTPAPGQKPGPEGVREVWARLHATFPGLWIEVEELLVEGDRLAARVAFREVSPETGQVVSRGRMMEFVRIEAGRVAELWNLMRLK